MWGGGGHGGVVLDALRQQSQYEPVAVLDDKDSGAPYHRSGVPILYGRHHLSRLREDGVRGMVIGIGDELVRSRLAEVAVRSGFELCNVVHPSAVICSDVRIGCGTVIFAGAVIQTGTVVGNNVIINTCASIDHDCAIGDASQIGPRAVLGGTVQVGDLTFIGIGATVINKAVVGRNCVIGAGAVVVRDIADHSIAFGVPARVMRQRVPF